MSRRRKLLLIAPFAILGFVAFAALGGLVSERSGVVMLPPLLRLPAITFWQAIGLLALSRILFGGFGMRGCGPRSRIMDRMGRGERMTAEERERLSGHLHPSPVSERAAPRGPGEWAPGFLERPISVRFSDVDLLGHVNNLRYLDYAQTAQVDLMTGVFREARVNGSVRTVIVRSEIDYVAQMNLRPEPYAVRSRVVAVGRHSASFEQEIRDGSRVMARSRIVEVNVDDDDRPLEWHPKHRDLFEQRMRTALIG